MPFGHTIPALPPCFAASDPIITLSQRFHLCCNLGAVPGQLPAAAGFPCRGQRGNCWNRRLAEHCRWAKPTNTRGVLVSEEAEQPGDLWANITSSVLLPSPWPTARFNTEGELIAWREAA